MATSLEILRPQPSSSTLHLSKRNPTNTLAQDLESRSFTIASSLANQEYSNPCLQKYMVPDFRAEVDVSTPTGPSRVPVVGRETYITQLKKNHEKVKLAVNIADASANVDEDAGVASVWLLLGVGTGGNGGMARETVMVLWWRREKGQWKCWQQACVRGVSGFRI